MPNAQVVMAQEPLIVSTSNSLLLTAVSTPQANRINCKLALLPTNIALPFWIQMITKILLAHKITVRTNHISWSTTNWMIRGKQSWNGLLTSQRIIVGLLLVLMQIRSKESW